MTFEVDPEMGKSVCCGLGQCLQMWPQVCVGLNSGNAL